MAVRAYLLLDISQGKTREAVDILRSNPGVVRIDALEGRPDLMVIIEASGQKRLTEATLRAFASVSFLAEDVRLLPARNKYSAARSGNNRPKKVKITGKDIPAQG